MHTLPDFKKVKIDDIVPDNAWDLRPFLAPQPSKDLRSSIATMGLLRPPILQQEKSKERSYQLLCGRRRFMAFCSVFAEETAITALVLPTDHSHEDILHYLLADEILTGNLSPMEKAYFFQHCLKYMSIESAAEKFLPLLNLKAQPHTIRRLISLLELEQEIQTSIHTDKLNEKLGLELLLLSGDDRLTLHTLFQQLEFGGGKQKRLLTLCKDLACRQEKSITTLMAEKEYGEILDHREMNRPQRGATLLGYLHKQLFPQSNKAEEEFNRRVKRMELPPSCTIEHSPAFERDDVSLRIQFPSLENLEKQIAIIRDLTRKVC